MRRRRWPLLLNGPLGAVQARALQSGGAESWAVRRHGRSPFTRSPYRPDVNGNAGETPALPGTAGAVACLEFKAHVTRMANKWVSSPAQGVPGATLTSRERLPIGGMAMCTLLRAVRCAVRPGLLAGVAVLLVGCSGGSRLTEEIIVDNRDADCTVVSGGWGVADSGDGNGCWGPDFLYLHAGEPAGVVRFAPRVPARNAYDVYIYWSAAANRTTEQPVLVQGATGAAVTYHVNLQRGGNRWYHLGRHTWETGISYIEFSNAAPSGYCNADAVRLTR